MKISQYIEYKLKKFTNYDAENSLQEIRYILQEHLGISLEDQVFKKNLPLINVGTGEYISIINLAKMIKKKLIKPPQTL